jgi:hypothetical protein
MKLATPHTPRIGQDRMSDVILSKLLSKVEGLDKTYRSQVLNYVCEGKARQALGLLNAPFLSVDRSTKAWGALQVHLLHLTGQYVKANQVLDSMIGLRLSEQLVMENCPSEADIVARWDPLAEGVSVLCTTFNHQRFIEMALASIFSQISSHPFEVIVRNDASTDETAAILKRWAQRYPRILRVLTLPENTYLQGIAPMPAAMAHAYHPLVAMCEGDDFWVNSNKLQQQADLLQKNSSWSAVANNHFELDEASGRLSIGRRLKARGYLPKQDLLNVNLVLWVHTLMLRKDRLQLPHFSIKDGVLGDQVITAMLGAAGPVYFQGDQLSSVARRNLSSTYTPLSEVEKQRKRIKTREFLSPVLLQRGERQAAEHMQRWCASALQRMPFAAEGRP